MELNDQIVQHFAMGRVFKDNAGPINSLDWHRTEDLLVTAGEDDSLHLYNSGQGFQAKVLFSKKYGACNVVFTHHANAILHASNKGVEQQTIRYLSLHDNRYLRYFRGHTGRITALDMSPINDLFMSAATDKQVRLWDLRVQHSQGLLYAPGQPAAAFDEQGLVFAVGCEAGVLKLYDVRSFAKGPFDTFTVPELVNSASAFSCIKFSADGKLMLAVAEGRLLLLDAYNGAVLAAKAVGLGDGGQPFQASFSPDCKYYLSGCEDRAIRVWSAAHHGEVAAWAGHAGAPTCVQWAPTRALVASACNALALWVPNLG